MQNKLPAYVLDTSAKIINYIGDLSYHIDKVRITAVYPGGTGFSFKVMVPRWYKIFFSKTLRKRIQKKVSERMIVGVEFDFTIYSEEWF